MLIFIIIIGLVAGSFLNVMIYRMVRGESLIFPPSHCTACGHRLAVWDLVPVVSFLALGGHCRYCSEKISWRYPLVELLSGALTVLWWIRIGVSTEGIAILVLVYALIAIAFIDYDHQIIPNKITIPFIVLGLLVRIIQGEWVNALMGGLVGGGILILIVLFYPRGMGMGDVKFLTMAGVWLGWYQALWILFLGSMLGTVVMIPLLLLKKVNRKTPFAFGPFLVVATLLIIYFKDWIVFIEY